MNPARPLHGRCALITGAEAGLGLAIADTLARSGADIVMHCLQANESARQAQAALAREHGVRVLLLQADLRDVDQIEAMAAQALAELPRLDILVNNAGQAVSQRFDRTDEALWQRMLAVNLTGTFHCIQAALPGMLDGGWGRVVNVASTAGLIGYAYVSAYCAAKHGVVGLTRALALETARKGVTVNAVCPGYTETDIVRGAVANIVEKTGLSEAEARATLAERNPQGRLINPEEVAETVAWLALPASAAINGQAIAVDGGEVMTG
ncbi:SDR family NAD(P)-dependent oxidoreductase [Bordetella pertussis]